MTTMKTIWTAMKEAVFPTKRDTTTMASNRQEDASSADSISVQQPAAAPPTAVVLTEDEVRANRSFMTIIHFLLTYPRWSFTLFLLLASTSFPSLPAPSQAVLEPMRNLRDMANTESSLYHECTVHAFDSMTITMNQTSMEQYQRVMEQRQRNQDVIHKQAMELTIQCSDATTLARRALQEWQRPGSTTAAASPVIPIIQSETNISDNSNSNNKTTCTTADRVLLSQVFGTNVSSANGGQASTDDDGDDSIIAGVLDDYLVASHTSLMRVTDYTRDRANYDYNYFVGIKIQASLKVLNQQFSPLPAISLNFSELAILAELRGILQLLLDIIADAKIRIGILFQRLDDFHVSIQAFYVNYIDVYGRLSLASAFLRDFVPPGIPIPDFFDMSAIPLPDTLLPSVFEIPHFQVDLPNVEVDLLPGILRDIIVMVANLVARLAQEATEILQKILQELLDLLRGLLLLEDYNPPQYVGSQDDVEDLEQEEAYLSELGDVTRQRLVDKVHAAITAGFVDGGAVIGRLDNISAPNVDFDTSPDLEGNFTTFEYLEPKFPDFTIPELVQAFFSLVIAHQWIIEVVIQLVRLVRLKRKYEKGAIPDLPEIDFRSRDGDHDDDEDKEPQVSTMQMLQLAVIKLFLTPWMALALVLSPLALAIVILWFPHAKRNCIDSQRGTIFARNLLAPLLVNEANLAGNAYHTQAELRCQRMQRQTCLKLRTESDRFFQSDLFALHQHHSRMNESLSFTNLLNRCIDTDIIDAEFETACCGLEGYATGDFQCAGDPDICPIDNSTIPPSAFRPVGREYLATNTITCSEGLSLSLENSVFDCRHLEDSCLAIAACDGVDSRLLRSMAIEADCQVQVYVMQCCLFVLVALYHALVINLASTLVFTGIQRMQWRKLWRCAESTTIQLRTQMSTDGKLRKGVASAKERAARIDMVMRRYERVGWMQVGFGCMLFLIWFTSFFVLRNALSNFVPQ